MEHLRKVSLDGFVLETWDTYRRDYLGKYLIGYRLTSQQGEEVFEGEDFGCSPLHSIDSDECLRAILSFLTLRSGDIEQEYFLSYNDRQLAFRDNDAERLSIWADDECGYPFVNLDGWMDEEDE